MSQIDVSKLLNLLLDSETKEENWSVKALDNLNRLWSRDNEILRDRLCHIEKEGKAQEMLKSKVQNLKKEIQELNADEINSKSKLSKLKCLLNETDNEICRRQAEERKLKQNYESRKIELGKLEKVKSMLETHQSLYDHCLNTRLSIESSNLLRLSFLESDLVIGWIKFEYDENRNSFKVILVEPTQLLPDSVLNKFHETQDTQGLLCYISQHLIRN